MSQRARHVTLRRQRDASSHVYNTHNTQQKFRKIPIEASHDVVSDPMARFPRWPKNVFFASDFIADRTSTAAAAAGAAAAGATVSFTNPRRAVSKEYTINSRGGAASRQRDGVGASNSRDTPSNRRYMRRALGASASERRYEAPRPRPSDKRGVRVAQQGVTLGGGEPSGNRSTIHNSSSTHKTPTATGKKEALFLEESASALLFLHSRFFRGVQRDEDLVCRLCMLCKEAGWMGDPKGVYSGLDPLVLEELLAERLEAKKRRSTTTELQGLERQDRPHRPATAGVLVFSFEDFYQTLADVACLVHPREANDEGGATSGRAMHRLLLEGVLPLAADSRRRVWSPRPEVLYGRPALVALRSQRDSLHQLYCSYSNNARLRTGPTGFNRQTFLRMLRDLGASPGSVSDERAKEVFDAVLRNGLPETQALTMSRRDSKSHHVMTNGWVAGASNESNANLVQRKGRTDFSDKVPISPGGRLCWSLFLEAMAALAVEAVEDRHGAAKRNDDHAIKSSADCSQSRHKEYTPRRHGSRLANHSTRRMTCKSSGAVRCGDDERPETREVNGSKNGSDKSRHKANVEQKLAASTGLHATGVDAAAGLSTKAHGQLHWRGPCGSCEFDDTTRKMKAMPTLPESNVLQEQDGMPVRHRISPEHHAVQQCYDFRGEPTSVASETACSSPRVTAITVNTTAKPGHLADGEVAVAPQGGTQTHCKCAKSLLDKAQAKMATTHAKPGNYEEKRSAASPDQDLSQSLHKGGDKYVTGLADDPERSMEEKSNAKASVQQVFESPAVADGFLAAVAAPESCNSSDESFISRSVDERPVGRKEKVDNPISYRNQSEPRVATSQARATKREHLCAANGFECSLLRENNDFKTSPRSQLTSVPSRVHPGYLPSHSAGNFFPFPIAGGRAQPVDDDVRTPAPCHGSSTTASTSKLASNEQPGCKGANQQEVAVKPIAPQGGNISDITSAAIAGDRVHPTSSLLSASGIGHTDSEPNSSSTQCEAALNCFRLVKGMKSLTGVTYGLAEVVRAKDDESGSAKANASCERAHPNPAASTEHTAAASMNSDTEDASVELSSARGLQNCTHGASHIGSEEGQTQGLRQDARSCGIADDVGDGCKEINQLEKHRGTGCAVGREGSGRTRGGGCHPFLQADRARATIGAAGCTTVIFEELLDPKVVAVYSRHREQLTTLFRRYSTGSNDTDDNCSEEAVGCVQDKGMRQFVNDFPSLGGWAVPHGDPQQGEAQGEAQGEGVLLELQLIVRASSDRGWRRLKGTGTRGDPAMAAIDMPPGGASGLCYLGFLEVLTRMAHAVRGKSPTHQKLLAMMLSLQAEDPLKIL